MELEDLKFVKLLTQTIQDQRLSRTELCVMSALVSKAYYDDKQKHIIATISATDLQAYIKTACLRTIRRSIQHLSEYGYIEVIRTNGQTNQYKILVDTGAKEDKPTQNQYKKKQNPSVDPDIEKYNVCINNFTLASDRGGDEIEQ